MSEYDAWAPVYDAWAAVRNVEGGTDVESLLDKADAALANAIDRGSAQLRAEQIARLRAARLTALAGSPPPRLAS